LEMRINFKLLLRNSLVIVAWIGVVSTILITQYNILFQNKTLQSLKTPFSPYLAVDFSIYEVLIILFSSIVAIVFLSSLKAALVGIVLTLVASLGIATAYSYYHILYVLGFAKYIEVGGFDWSLALYCVLMNFKKAFPVTIALIVIGAVIGFFVKSYTFPR